MTIEKTSSVSSRIEAIDVLRGFTLMGIALIHFVEQYYAGPPPASVVESSPSSIGDGIAEAFVSIFIMGKFFMIFSFLFGLSFFIQLSNSNADKHFLFRFAWRLIILLLIGTVHHLHYRGDILSIYAVLGFALLVLYKIPDRALLIVSLLLILNVPSLIVRGLEFFVPINPNPLNTPQETLLAYYNTVKSGSYFEILRANFFEFKTKLEFQVWSGRVYITLGLFLLGIYAGRKRFFENINANIPFFKRSIRYALWSILACVVMAVLIFGGSQALRIQLSQQVMFLVGGFLMDFVNGALALVYVSWLLILFNKEKWQKRLMIFYPVGRMGLTTYLVQTVIGTLIFFSYGFGLLFEFGALYCLTIGFIIFLIQAVFAQFWFKHFLYGPVEWLWRTLTYFKLFKIYRPRVITSEVVS